MKTTTSQDLPVIDFFDGTEYDFLSNFHPSEVTLYGGLCKPEKPRSFECETVEHAFQAAKSPYLRQIESIATAAGPGAAKAMGRTCDIRTDWEAVKVEIMRELVRQKFTRHHHLGQMLLDTAPAILIEGNTWHDRFWGVYEGEGLNWLGIILMEVRNELMVMRGRV